MEITVGTVVVVDLGPINSGQRNGIGVILAGPKEVNNEMYFVVDIHYPQDHLIKFISEKYLTVAGKMSECYQRGAIYREDLYKIIINLVEEIKRAGPSQANLKIMCSH